MSYSIIARYDVPAPALFNGETHYLTLDQNGSLRVVSGARYNSPDIALSAGQTAELQLTAAGFLRNAEQFAPGAEDNTNAIYAVVPKPLAVSTYVASTNTNKGSVNAANLKATAGNLFSLWVFNTNAAARYCFLVDSASTPVAASASLYLPIYVPSNTLVMVGEDVLGQTGVNFASGIGLAFMTTIGGGTLATAAETFWTARFK